MLQKTLCRILGCALLLWVNTALAFTLIPIPSSEVTNNSYTLDSQVQSIAGTIRSQIFGLRRPESSQKTTQVGGLKLAANDYSSSRSDANNPTAWGANAGNTQSLWISSTIDSLANTFERTEFRSATQNVLVGYDFTLSGRYVFGISGGYEASSYVTTFNSGNEKTGGYNVNPYFAWLISDAWSLDVIGGYGKFNTQQDRSLAGILLDSDFSSKRTFASTNLTNIAAFGNWKLTSSLGYQWSKRDTDAYTEADGAITVPESKQISRQWNLLEEIAYGRGNSETYFGARYEYVQNYQDLVLTGGLGEQPANDPTSFLLTLGWRYFAKNLTASFVFSGRVGQEQVKEHGFAMVLRADL